MLKTHPLKFPFMFELELLALEVSVFLKELAKCPCRQYRPESPSLSDIGALEPHVVFVSGNKSMSLHL